MKHSLKILLSLFVFLFSNIVAGQLNYKKGYIITQNNDTLHGFICDRGEIKNATQCLFKEYKNSAVIKFNPNEIKSYRFINGKYYQSLNVLQKEKYLQKFAEVLVHGKINLYHFWRNRNAAYYIENEYGKITRLSNELFYLKDDSNSFYERTKYYAFEIEAYKNNLDSIFDNCIGFKSKIEDLEYDTKPLVDITKEYLNCSCDNRKCIDYVKNFDISKPTFGFFSGVQFSKIFFLESDIQSDISISFPFGLFYNLPLPLINERVSFQIELLYNSLKYNQGFINLPALYSSINISSKLVSAPLSIRYTIPMNKLSASLGIGKESAYIFYSEANTVPNKLVQDEVISVIEFEYREKGFFIHHSQKEGWFLDLGLDYKLSPKFSIYANTRFQSNLNLIIEEENYNNYQFYMAEKMNNLVNPHRNIYRTNTATLFIGIKF
jgi:hypothetical protein